MNISTIKFNFLPISYSQKPDFQTNRYAYNQLRHDTVTFTSGAKNADKEWNNEISCGLANKVAEEATPDLKYLLAVLKKNFKPLMVSEQNPDRILLPIKGRVKDPLSIIQKAGPRDLHTKNDIEQMGDIIGTRLVLAKSTRKDFDEVFRVLGEMVKNGELKITEIENYRMTRAESFVSSKTLDKFEDICHSKGIYPSRTGQTIPNGYTAIHLTAELPSGKLAEIQIMSKEMELVKDLEDFYYKLRYNKHLDPKYATIEELMKTKMANFTNFQKETLDMYIKDSYKNAFNLSVNPPDKKSKTKHFIPFPYSLPQELSFAELQKMKEKCDREWKLKTNSK